MRYQDAIAKIPNALYIYEGVTQEESDSISGIKYEIADDSGENLFVIGTVVEIEELKNKQMAKTFGMKFG